MYFTFIIKKTPICSFSEPEPVKELFVPNPLIDKHVFYNETVGDLFNSSFSLTDINSFKSYALSQRQLRWEIICTIQNIENLLVKYRESKDGIWSNCRCFASAEDVKCHTAKVAVMANTIPCWKSSELEYYDNPIKFS